MCAAVSRGRGAEAGAGAAALAGSLLKDVGSSGRTDRGPCKSSGVNPSAVAEAGKVPATYGNAAMWRKEVYKSEPCLAPLPAGGIDAGRLDSSINVAEV